MKRNIQEILLKTIASVGIASVAILAPNALQALSLFGFGRKKRFERDTINRSLRRLIQKGMIVKNDKGFLELTKKGRTQLHDYSLNDHQIPVPKKWDKKWRVLIFDIPEKRKKVRDQIRDILARMGLIRLQDSVWVHPYECEDIVNLLKTDLYVGKSLLYLVVESIEGDSHLKKHFDLI